MPPSATPPLTQASSSGSGSAGSERPAATLEPAAGAVRWHVRQRRLLPLGLLCGVVADGGAPLLQHREPHRAPERQELLGHLPLGQTLRVTLGPEFPPDRLKPRRSL